MNPEAFVSITLRKENRTMTSLREKDLFRQRPDPSRPFDIDPMDSNRNVETNSQSERLEPTRYGDWEKKGRCIDF